MRIKLIIALVFMLFSQLAQAEISISVDRSPVVTDESFQLVFESNEKVDGEPDFTPLNKSFSILNTARRSNTKMINGTITRSQRWILTVLAKRSGILDIPEIHFGKDISRANSIKVDAKAPAAKGKNTDDVFIEVEVDTKIPYVQAQVIYTVKLYRAVQTNNASLSEPAISGGQAVINKLGEDQSFETRLNGKRYVIIQRQYVIFPQSSGIYTIEPIVFQGQTGSASFFNFDPYGAQSRTIVKRSDSIILDVKSIPDTFTGNTWLPASQLNIHEQWSVDPAKLKQGEATTRTLILTANGLAASHLPVIEDKLPEKLKQYPDQAELSETNNENGFVGIRHDKTAIIPTEAGNYLLPAIKVPWWNTKTDKMEVAELPERSIHADISAETANDNLQQQVISNELSSVEKENNEIIIDESESIQDQSFWKWLSFIFLILWLTTLFIFWKSKRSIASATNKHSATEPSARQYLKQLKQACAVNNPVQAKQALLDWSKVNWPDEKITSIDTVKSFCEQDLQLNIDKLNVCLYGKEASTWAGAEFLRSFESQSFDKKKTIKSDGNLESLYKT